MESGGVERGTRVAGPEEPTAARREAEAAVRTTDSGTSLATSGIGDGRRGPAVPGETSRLSRIRRSTHARPLALGA